MFWQGRKVLVTGHTGFKGAWLTLWLQRLGAEVTGYALEPPSRPSLFEAARVAEGIRDHRADVRDLESLTRVMAESGAEIVFHLAAQALVRESYRAPVDTFAINVMGTINVLEAVRRATTPRVVIVVTSDKCYENREWHWGYREIDAVGGHDPYSASKGAAEIVTSSYRRSFFTSGSHCTRPVAVSTVRAGNVIGGGDWGAEKLVPDIVRTFCDGVPLLIRSPNALRPWQHTLDALHGYMLLAERMWSEPELADAWNFGPSDSDTRPVQWIVERMTKLWGGGASWQLDSRPAPHEATLLRLDSSKARALLGWKPRLDLDQALEWTVEWYRAHHSGRDMRSFTLEQLERYVKL
ncbi:MAG TPA: CDP-glucose 4,6-dehydratase [Steroidobacteraceae bacterium]